LGTAVSNSGSFLFLLSIDMGGDYTRRGNGKKIGLANYASPVIVWRVRNAET